jgi:hypothetical protein
MYEALDLTSTGEEEVKGKKKKRKEREHKRESIKNKYNKIEDILGKNSSINYMIHFRCDQLSGLARV